jgi:hypothetical protein
MITTTSPEGEIVKWTLSDGVDFFSRFYHFLMKKDFDKYGKTYKLDSALTDPIVQQVTKNYENLILAHQNELLDMVLLKIVTSDALRESIVNHITVTNPLAKINKGVAKKVVENLLIGGLKEKLIATSSNIAHEVMNSTTQILSDSISSGVATKAAIMAAKAATTSVGKIAISKLAFLISKSLIPMLTKLLAKPAVAMMMKKFVVTAVLGSFLKIAAAKLGLSFGAALWIVLLPLLAAWIKRDIDNFPITLATEISQNVRQDMNIGFETNLSTIYENLLESFTERSTIDQLANSIVQDSVLMASLTSSVIETV